MKRPHRAVAQALMPAPYFPSIIIIGAGPIGLYTGHVLASVGCDVTLIDDGRRGAGWASGGMLGAVYETLDAPEFPETVKTFALSSQRLWRHFLLATSTPFVAKSIFVARDGQEQDRLTTLASLARQHNLDMAQCDMPKGIEAQVAWSCETDIALNPRDMPGILRRECFRNGVKVVEGVVSALAGQKAVLTSGQQFQADFIVVATGAFAAGQSGAALGASVPELACLRPEKGQMLAIAGPDDKLDHVVRAGRTYIIPRGDRLVIGATSELGNADPDLFDRDRHTALWNDACALLPALARGQIIESWAGLRPKTPDGLPLVGFSQRSGVILATGAYRNGWLFAAGIANAVMGLVLEGDSGATNLQPFAPNRFPT